jgi:ribosomal protein L29
MEYKQLILFEELQEEEELKKSVNQLQKQVSNLRRGLFSRQAELMKMYAENKYELDSLKRNICRPK